MAGLAGGFSTSGMDTKDQGDNESVVAVRHWTVDAIAPTLRCWAPTGTGIRPTAKPTVLSSESMNKALLERSVAGKPTTFFLKKDAVKIAATVSRTCTPPPASTRRS